MAVLVWVAAVVATPALASAQDPSAAVDAAAVQPSALTDGVVTDAPLPVEPKKRPTGGSAFAPGMLLIGVVALTVGAVGYGTRGLPRLT